MAYQFCGRAAWYCTFIKARRMEEHQYLQCKPMGRRRRQRPVDGSPLPQGTHRAIGYYALFLGTFAEGETILILGGIAARASHL